MDDGFDDLLVQAEQLRTTLDPSSGELPRVERNLRQLMDASEQLWQRTEQQQTATGLVKETSDVKAAVLLGTKGLSLPRITPKLDAVSFAKTLEPIEPLPETDIEGFLRNERQNTILSLIEETRRTAFSEADRLYWEKSAVEWERQKQKILNSFFVDVGQQQQPVLPYSKPSTTEQYQTNVVRNVRSAMDNVDVAYAKQVYVYNETVINGGIKPNFAEKFAEVARQLDDKNVVDLWTMVEYMIDVPVLFGEDALTSRASPLKQKAFVRQACRYLEDGYLKYMKVTVYGNLKQAVLGGVPGTLQLVSSYLNLKLTSSKACFEDGTVNGHPVWPMIYYSLRCGDLVTAVRIAASAGAELEEFRTYLAEFVQNNERRLSSRSETLIRVMYKRAVQNCTDPYKRAVFCVVGGCDVRDDHPSIADKIDDYLWLKLSQLEPCREEVGGDAMMTLAQFQTKLLEDYGESHFRAYQQPFFYFEVLFLSAQFEAAIEFLARIDSLRSHAVHVALVLFEANILALPASINAPLLSKDAADVPPQRRLNFARLVTLYTKKFESTDPREALQYFYFLRGLSSSKDDKNLFMSCVSELVLETREFDMLLGRLEPDGCRLPGLIDKFGGDTQRIIEAVAADSEERGLLEDAVRLFDLAKRHEKVMDLLNKMLSNVASRPSLPQSRRERLHSMAVDVAERYRSTDTATATRSTTSTFYLLLDLLTFFDLCHADKHQEAIDVLRKLKLIPLDMSEVEQHIVLFKELADDVRRVLPDVLVAAVDALHALYVNAKNSSPRSPVVGTYFTVTSDGGHEQYLSRLRKQAQTLVTFGGMLPYRMPGDTVARLVQKEILMH